MSRYCFKRKMGYVNITTDSIYLTNSGNWTEIQQIQEKSKETIRINNRRKVRIKLFLYPSLILFALILVANLTSLKVLSIGTIIAFAGSVAVYKYFLSDLGNRYKIPIDKIIKVEIIEESMFLQFYDSQRNITSEEIQELSTEAIAKIQEICAK